MGDVDKRTLFGFINARIAELQLQRGQSVEIPIEGLLEVGDVTIILTPRQDDVKRAVKEAEVDMSNIAAHIVKMMRELNLASGQSMRITVFGFAGCDLEIIVTARNTQALHV